MDERTGAKNGHDLIVKSPLFGEALGIGKFRRK